MAASRKKIFSVQGLLLLLGAAIALVIVAATAFIALFPKDWAIAEVTHRIEQATGRQLTIAGKIDIAFWPAIGFSAEHVSLSNPAGFADEPFLAANRIVFAVKVLPLLRGAVEVKELILDGADIHLAAKADGSANWTFPTEQNSNQSVTMEDLKLDDVSLRNSRLTFIGPAGGAPLTLENIDGALRLTSLDSPAHLQGAFDYARQRVNVAADIGLPRAMLERGATPLTAQARSGPLDADFDGRFDSSTGAFTGTIKASGDSLREVMAWTGSPMQSGDGFGAFNIESDFAHSGERYAFTGGTFKLDAITAEGDVTVTMPATGRMRADGALSTALLDVNPYMPPPPQGASAGGGVQMNTAWSAAPLDLSGLRAFDANLNFTIQRLKFQRMSFADARMALRIASGVADARLSHVTLYGGAGTAHLVADGARATPRVAVELNADNVQALPLLTDAIGLDKIEGHGRLHASIAGQGASQAAIMRSLAGSAAFSFNDGAWRGVNLAQVARTVQSALSGTAATSGSNATDFAELSATFQLADGVAATQDLKLLNPYVRLDGAGLVDVGAQTLDMRLSPRAVNSMQGQGGQANLQGLGVPFRISGPWTHPSFRPDLSDAMRQQLRDRLSAAAGRQGADSPLGMLSGTIFGAPDQSQTTQPQQPAAQPAQPGAPPAQTGAQQQQPAHQPTTEEQVRDALGGLFKGGN